MRTLRSVVGLICIATLLGLCLLEGCPEQAEDPVGQVPQPTPDPEAEAGAGVGAGTDVTMEEIIAKWPSSFVMTQTLTKEGSEEEMVVVASVKMGDEGPEKIKTQVDEGAGLIDFAGKTMYMWETGATTAMKMAIPEEAANPYEDVDLATEIAGEDVVDGVECWVTETTKDDTQVRTWWGKDDGLMRRVESGDTVSLFEYEQIGSVPESEFELPEGMTVKEMEIPQMPQQ
jgi:hypothetical protein